MPKRVKPIRWPSITASSRTRLALDAGLLRDLLHRHLGRRVADVGPARRVQPDARVGALHEQHLAVVVADDRRRSPPSASRSRARPRRRTPATPARSGPVSRPRPRVGLDRLVGRGLDVGRDVAAPPRSAPARTGSRVNPSPVRAMRGQRLAPAQQVAGEVDRSGPSACASSVHDRPTPVTCRARSAQRRPAWQHGPLDLAAVERRRSTRLAVDVAHVERVDDLVPERLHASRGGCRGRARRAPW